MKCAICPDGEIRPATATVTLEREGKALAICAVPAEICENCGEEYIEPSAARRAFEMSEAVAPPES
jgi:YgiT-type zinc finger domain-containing protein